VVRGSNGVGSGLDAWSVTRWENELDEMANGLDTCHTRVITRDGAACMPGMHARLQLTGPN